MTRTSPARPALDSSHQQPRDSASGPMPRPTAAGLVALASSAIALAVAPLALDGSYSWLQHTTSEAGGQGVDGAWVARTGFLLFGLATLWIAVRSQRRWGQPATALHLGFAVCMFAVAGYSIRSWLPDAGFDATEDMLHSVAATTMGFAFAFGVAAVAVQRMRFRHPWRALDAVAVAASVVLPIGMSLFGSIDGALQRAMFAIAYIWYSREALLPGQEDRS